jgi:outer membrane protein
MKKFIILSVAMSLMSFAASAQNYMVVNTETVFTSMATYTNAEASLERLGEQYQREIDDAFAGVEKRYNDYIAQKPYLSESSRVAHEGAILDREAEIQERQESLFGPEGELMKKRVEIIKPIQDRVFEAINRYAQSNGFALVIDLANNPTVLYYSPAADKTQEIIKLVK